MAAGHEYLNAFINNSATVREKLGADIENAPHKQSGNKSIVK
jgi:hypothetical protein